MWEIALLSRQPYQNSIALSCHVIRVHMYVHIALFIHSTIILFVKYCYLNAIDSYQQ